MIRVWLLQVFFSPPAMKMDIIKPPSATAVWDNAGVLIGTGMNWEDRDQVDHLIVVCSTLTLLHSIHQIYASEQNNHHCPINSPCNLYSPLLTSTLGTIHSDQLTYPLKHL